MNRLHFGENACETTRGYLDSYINNELLVETKHQVLDHLQSCPACSADLESRTRLRARLKAAVQRQAVPPELQVLVRDRLRAQESRSWFHSASTRWGIAMAASLMVVSGIWFNSGHERMPGLSDLAGQNVYIQKVSASLAAVLRVGLVDHIHCAIFRKYSQNPPTVAQLEEKLGPSYKGLLPAVKAAVPDGYRIILAHECGYAGRTYIHLTMRKDSELLSLIVTRKNPGETLSGLTQSAAAQYQVAGFEAGNYLAFVISDLRSKVNLQIATNLVPAVQEFLSKNPA